jgi:abortive infection bacteriophage resistance protein
VVYIIIAIHVAAMLWFGVIANDLAMARCRRLRERAVLLDDFALPGMTNGGTADRRSHASWIRDVRKQIGRNADHPFVRAYKRKYTSSADMPLWMAVELMTLGNVLRLYQGARVQERQPVASVFGSTVSDLGTWLLMLHNVRNICAHHGRFWNRKLANAPSIPSTWRRPVDFESESVFAALTVCAYCMGRTAPGSDWSVRVRSLMERYAHIPKRPASGWSMGVPDNWLDCPIWSVARPSATAPPQSAP